MRKTKYIRKDGGHRPFSKSGVAYLDRCAAPGGLFCTPRSLTRSRYTLERAREIYMQRIVTTDSELTRRDARCTDDEYPDGSTIDHDRSTSRRSLARRFPHASIPDIRTIRNSTSDLRHARTAI